MCLKCFDSITITHTVMPQQLQKVEHVKLTLLYTYKQTTLDRAITYIHTYTYIHAYMKYYMYVLVCVCITAVCLHYIFILYAQYIRLYAYTCINMNLYSCTSVLQLQYNTYVVIYIHVQLYYERVGAYAYVTSIKEISRIYAHCRQNRTYQYDTCCIMYY